jgi:hypothetical protein
MKKATVKAEPCVCKASSATQDRRLKRVLQRVAKLWAPPPELPRDAGRATQS